MPISPKLLATFYPECTYHIICKSTEGRKLFSTDQNRFYFLQRYHEFLNDFTDTYAYCLLNNHVHWFIKTKSESAIQSVLEAGLAKPTITHQKFLLGECSFHELIEQQYNRFFIAYSLAYNISLGVKGHLFNRPFKRIEVENDGHFTQLIIYIHANAEKHGLVNDFNKHKWSSYRSILSDKPTHLKREEVLAWFGGREKFMQIHTDQVKHYYNYLHGEE